MARVLPTEPPPHPRLFVVPGDLARTRQRAEGDPCFKRLAAVVCASAEELLNQPPAEFEMSGIRLLAVSREVLRRVLALAAVYHLTSDRRFARRAAEEMTTACRFPHWNPDHYLDAAEMTLGIAVGYDWLFDELAAAEREEIAAALWTKGLAPSLDEDHPRVAAWLRRANNWNQVCHAGVAVGAIAIADHHPDAAERIVARAVAHLRGGDVYAPDGAYPEGASYWDYGTGYHVLLIDALRAVTGHAHGLDAFAGFRESAGYVQAMTTPTGMLYNYADCWLEAGTSPVLFWFAHDEGRDALVRFLRERFSLPPEEWPHEAETTTLHRLLPFALLWGLPPATNGDAAPSRSQLWRGAVPVALHRSTWFDSRATFVGMRGGSSVTPHAHQDVGAFLLEADGVRWAVDPGRPSYGKVERMGLNLWDYRDDGDRWGIFCLGPEAHNILRFDGSRVRVDGVSDIVAFSARRDWTIVDLSPTYAGSVASVRRGVWLQPDRSVLIQDEWRTGEVPVDVRWQWLTFAEEVDRAPGRVELRQAGESLELRVPADVRIEVEDLSQHPDDLDAPRPGLKRLTLHVRTEAATTRTFRVHAVPGSVTNAAPAPALALADWPAA